MGTPPMQQAVELRGKAASQGIFTGPVVALGDTAVVIRKARNPTIERAELNAAIATAVAAIRSLATDNTGDSADILEFQIAMLEDPELRDRALAAIARGSSATAAWWDALEREVSVYANSSEDAFSARAADLRDIRDRVLRALSGEARTYPERGCILLGDDLPPSLFLETDWSQGGAIALRQGSTSSHVAMLARSRSVPMVIGLGPDWPENCKFAIVDGTAGLVLAAPPPELIAAYAARSVAETSSHDADGEFLLRPARLQDGRHMDVLVNIVSVEELAQIQPQSCDGIGLVRSEFLFRDGAALPNEEEQYLVYRAMLEWSGDRPVTVRTLDVGGDKPLRGLTTDDGGVLGLRGVSLSLQRPDVFCIQLRALARAAVHGNLKIMLPMVSVVQELEQSAQLLESCVMNLQAEGTACAKPPLGIMVEVPAVAIAPEIFAAAAFFSIGTNDLTQFIMARSRMEVDVPDTLEAVHPALFRLIANVARCGKDNGIPVSLCGELAGNAKYLKQLVEAGITSLSVPPNALARVKATLARI